MRQQPLTPDCFNQAIVTGPPLVWNRYLLISRAVLLILDVLYPLEGLMVVENTTLNMWGVLLHTLFWKCECVFSCKTVSGIKLFHWSVFLCLVTLYVYFSNNWWFWCLLAKQLKAFMQISGKKIVNYMWQMKCRIWPQGIHKACNPIELLMDLR